MSYQINTVLRGTNPSLQILDATSGSVRVAWEYPKHDAGGEESDPDFMAMERERAVHQLFCKLFLLTTEQYLKGELPESTDDAPDRKDR